MWTTKGAEYKGTKAEDQDGNECKNWSVTNYSDVMSSEDKNFCRNPDNDSKPWCKIVSNSTETDLGYCDIPKCGELYAVNLGATSSLGVGGATVIFLGVMSFMK